MSRRNSKSKPCRLDMKLFDPILLRDATAVEIALHNVANCVHNAVVEPAVELMLPNAHMVEFVWSVSAESIAAGLTESILSGFPQSCDVFFDSLAYRLISALSLSLLFVVYPTRADTPADLDKHRKDIESTSAVLRVLASIKSWEGGEAEPVEEEEPGDIVIKVKKSQRQRKQAKRSGRGSVIDSKPFDNMRLSVPTSSAEAQALAGVLLFDLKVILTYYLHILRRPALRETFRSLYVPQESDVTENSVSDEGVSVDTDKTLVEVEVPSAYPMVQPMKAALYFDSAEGFGEWRILMSTKAEKSLRAARRNDANAFKIIVKKIKELSNGHFSDDNQKRLTGPHTEIPVFEAKMTRDSRLVYQVDCIPDYDSEYERQVIKVYGVYTHAQLDGRFWDSMGHQLSSKGKEYRQRCVFRNKPRHTGDNVISPAMFPKPAEDVLTQPQPLLNLRKEDLEELHSLLVLEKFVNFSQALLNSILADHDVAHVFNVSPQEKQIIEHSSSCYVLGRSGTGKTTTMMFKMLGMERSWQLFSDTIKPRQIFVTQSRVLAGKVEEYFAKLIESLVTASHSPQELKLLVSKKVQQGEELIDLDDEDDWRSELPKKYSLLEDEHFPLFITFDRLCALLEADIHDLTEPAAFSSPDLSKNRRNSITLSPTSPVSPMDLRFGDSGRNGDKTSSGDYMQQSRASFVSYGTFLGSYWNHFPQSLTKGLDPSLVFSEFMGVIKGSEETLDTPSGFLDREAYDGLSHRSQATFSTQRDHIYSLFVAYLKRKKSRGDYDAADRTHSIVKYIRNNGLFGRKIDFLYVDEVQDNLLIDSLLLRSICGNPRGLFWAGDTAQTISVGSAFKFTDLKAFQFRIEKQMVDYQQLSTTPPHEFQLTVNYRSHGGIVQCAHSVVELITKFWPYSIDILAPERGVVNGLKPVFFTGWDQDTVRYEQFLFGSAGSQIEFGAQQCILVRNDFARDKLRKQVGDIGLIMTLYESKGLEFDDVLLFNFFEDSTADLSQWRVVLNAIKPERGSAPPPRFDDNRHAGICTELKFLYVAITRARKNLWVVDRSEKGEPMRVYWTSKDQVENCDPSSVPHMAVSSTPEEWVKTGETLFKNKRYLQAMHSFERAGRPREAAVSYSYYLREQARLTPETSRSGSSEKSTAYIEAANAFNRCAAAAEEGQRRQRIVWYRNAAECFIHAGEDGKAATAYVNATEYTLAARYYRKAGMFDKVVEVIKEHEDKVETAVADRLINVAKIFYLKKSKISDAISLFSSDEDALEFMEDFDLDVARATVLETLGRNGEAAELHLEEGRTVEAIKLFIKDPHNRDLMRRGSECLLGGLWQNLSFSVLTTTTLNPILKQLLNLAKEVNTELLAEDGRHEIAMFLCIASGEHSKLPDIAINFRAREQDNYQGNQRALLLCLDHFFSSPPKIQAARTADVLSTLSIFYQYVSILRHAALATVYPDRLQKLFGFKVSEDHTYFLPAGTLLYEYSHEFRVPAIHSDESGMTVSEWEFSNLYRMCIFRRMRIRILQENDVCRRSQAFTPCINYSIGGQCNRIDCQNAHIPSKDLNADWYIARLRLYFVQIQIMQTLDVGRRDKYEIQRYWLGQLYEALHPAYFKHGSSANLVFQRIPEAPRALPIVKEWIYEVLSTVEPYLQSRVYLTTVMRTVSLGFSLDRNATAQCLSQAHCYSSYRPPSLLRPGNAYVIHDMVVSLHGNDSARLSAGILFIEHVILNRIPIDIGTLCHYAEIICGSIILCRRYQRGSDAGLDDIVLPASWFSDLAYVFTILDQLSVALAFKFLDPLLDVLRLLSSEDSVDESLSFEGRPLRARVTRNVFIQRISRMLVIFGRYSGLALQTQRIFQTITKLPRPPQYAPHYPFVSATSWPDLCRAMKHSMSDSLLDGLVLLEHINKKKSSPPGWARVVNYQFAWQIPEIMRTGAGGLPISLRSNAAPFVPRQIAPDSTATPAEPENQADEDEVQEATDEVIEEVDAEAISRAIPSDALPVTSYSDRDRAAVQRIWSAYRLFHSKRQAESKGGPAATRNIVFKECLTESAKLEFPRPYYRLLFLGPLPHILLCLNAARDYAVKAKTLAKKRMKVAKHEELEEVMDKQTKCSALLKKTIELQNSLTATSDLHRKRDLVELKARVLKVEKLMRELPSEIQNQCAEDLCLGVTAIARPRESLNRKKLKPELVVEIDL